MISLILLAALVTDLSTAAPAITQTTFVLTANPNSGLIERVTKNVKLRCESPSANSAFSSINDIRIEKLSGDGSYEHVAFFSKSRSVLAKNYKEVGMDGKITEDTTGSFIELTWDVASEYTMGTYICKVEGFKGMDSYDEETKPVEIEQSELSAVLHVILNEHSGGSTEVDDLKETVDALLEASEKNQALVSNVNSTVNELKTKVAGIESKLDSVVKQGTQNAAAISNLHGTTNELKTTLDNINQKVDKVLNEVTKSD